MKRLLCIVSNMNAGGAETFLMKVYRKIDKNNYQIDFCVAMKEKNFYEDEIIKFGGKIYRITPKSQGILKNFNDIKRIVKDNEYNYVLRISQHSLSSLELLAAKLGGAKVLAFRASNTSSEGGIFNKLIHQIFKPIANIITTVKIAPSTEAARYVFGKKIVKKNDFYLLKNGLDINKFKYSELYRKKIRYDLKVKDKFVIGHVGRFYKQKNHKFLLDIFRCFLTKNKNSVLLLIGTGELEKEIKEYANELGITDNIIFYGVSDRVNEFYSAMDFYLFPSFFEGMPNTVIEAQTSGLQCLVSDTITKECKITDRVQFKSLQDSAEEWSKEIFESKNRDEVESVLYDKLYDIDSVVHQFEKIIFGRE